MVNAIHPVSCVALTRAMFEEIIQNPEENSYDVHLISPMGNIVMLGEIDKIEYSEEDGDIWEYTIFDASEVKRIITFTQGQSDYSVLIGPEGYLRSTTGLLPPEGEDKVHWQDWYMQELGMKPLADPNSTH